MVPGEGGGNSLRSFARCNEKKLIGKKVDRKDKREEKKEKGRHDETWRWKVRFTALHPCLLLSNAR